MKEEDGRSQWGEGMERSEKLDNWTEGWERGFVKADILDDYRLRIKYRCRTRYVQSTDLACRGNQRSERDLTNRAAQI